MTAIRPVNTNCRHYLGDRPCRPHKEHGAVCEGCEHADLIESRVLIVKLGATGDVLRTTAILGSVKDLHPQSHITWICGRASYSLIKHNPLIDRPLIVNEESLLILGHEAFDLCVNFDLDPAATAIDGMVNASERKGFGADQTGAAFAYGEAAGVWLNMSLWDDAKKANTLTYQAHMRRILGAPDANHEIQVPLLADMEIKAQAFADAHSLNDGRPVIGLNVGAGDRWEHKKWTVEGFAELAGALHREMNAHILILYGPADRGRAHEVMAALSAPYIDAQLRESMMEFIAIVNLCDLVVTGDTFALHVALGLKKRVVCLVGPTSSRELELYGRGEILQGDIDCLGCYLTRCGKDPHCMKLLPASRALRSIQSQLAVQT